MMRITEMMKPANVERQWHIIDAAGIPLGRLATRVAHILRGKHRPTFTPHIDNGDHVIVVNAAKVALTGNKLDSKVAYRHSGYPGGLKAVHYRDLMARHPERLVRKAVWGMLPKNRLGRKMLRKIRIYAGADHPHQAQQPVPLEVE